MPALLVFGIESSSRAPRKKNAFSDPFGSDAHRFDRRVGKTKIGFPKKGNRPTFSE
jgi:hypothetical protein